MSDQQYQDFLDRASSNGLPKYNPSLKTTAVAYVTTESVPVALHGLDGDRVYVTEGEESFRLVSLACKIEGPTPSHADFANAIGSETAEVEDATVGDFDPQKEYTDVVDKVAQAGGRAVRDVKVFKTKGLGARYDYWLVTVGKEGTSLVGYVVTAIES